MITKSVSINLYKLSIDYWVIRLFILSIKHILIRNGSEQWELNNLHDQLRIISPVSRTKCLTSFLLLMFTILMVDKIKD